VQLGCGLFQVTQKDGRRWSAASAYLHPVSARANLTVLKKAQATRVLIERGRAVGVEYARGRRRHTVRAAREAVLAAGAINSPQLLLVSGVGPAEELRARGVSLAHDLPGVGKNLQDHLNVNIVRRAERGSTLDSKNRWLAKPGVALEFLLYGTGPGTSNVAEAGAFATSELGAATPPTSSIISFRRRWSIMRARRWTATVSPCTPAACGRKAAAKSGWPRPIRFKHRSWIRIISRPITI
jgi:choline dehydrogenase